VDEARKKGDGLINEFKAGEWKSRSRLRIGGDSHEEICVNTNVNLDKVWDSKNTMTHSFFSYSGSDSQPPCNEDVFWIIMKDRLLINRGALEELEKKVTDGINNNRRVMPSEDREVFSHDECNRFIYPDTPIGPPPDAQYVKAHLTNHYYAIIHPDSKTMFDSNPSRTKINMQRGTEKYSFEKIDDNKMESISP